MFKGTIYKRIWKHIKEKIKEAQTEYDNGVIDLEIELEDKKKKLEENVVTKFLSKLY